jgi:AcrR family transcriptional regulator
LPAATIRKEPAQAHRAPAKKSAAKKAPAKMVVAKTGTVKSGARRQRLAPEARRTQIMDCAVDLIVARGLSSCTLEEVAVQAGISKPLVYRYFDSREALLKAVLEREYTYLRGRGLDVMPKNLPYERVLRGSVLRAMQYLYERGPILRLLASDRSVAALAHNRDRDERSAMRSYFSGIVARTFGIAEEDAFVIATLTINAPILSARSLKKRGIPPERVAALWSEFILGGYRHLEALYAAKKKDVRRSRR